MMTFQPGDPCTLHGQTTIHLVDHPGYLLPNTIWTRCDRLGMPNKPGFFNRLKCRKCYDNTKK